MKSNYLKNILAGAAMTLFLIVGFGSSRAVQAQYPYPDDRYRQDDRYRRDQDRWRRERERNRRDDYDDRWGQDRWRRGRWDGYPNWGGGFELRQTALNAGYNEGLRQGRNDRDRRRGYDYDYGYNVDFWRFSSYRNATRDYNSRFGDRELYRRYFRLAFENGYADGLRGY